MGNVRLSLKPENLECNLFLKYNLRALGVESKGNLQQVPNDFVAPNSPSQELPEAVMDTAGAVQDEDDVEIVISSDEE